MSVEINEINLNAFLFDPAGGVSRFMETVIAPDILQLAKDTISRPFPGHGTRGTRFPPPGPPYLRTSDLRESLSIVSASSTTGTEYDIVPNAIHRGVNYGLILKARGYRFLPDSYYL